MATSQPSHYLYTPSAVLAGVVAGLYGVSFLVTLVQIIRKRSWVWLIMLLAIASRSTSQIPKFPSSISYPSPAFANDCRFSGGGWVCDPCGLSKQCSGEDSLRCSVRASHSRPGTYGWCHLCGVFPDCILGCTARASDDADDLGSS